MTTRKKNIEFSKFKSKKLNLKNQLLISGGTMQQPSILYIYPPEGKCRLRGECVKVLRLEEPNRYVHLCVDQNQKNILRIIPWKEGDSQQNGKPEALRISLSGKNSKNDVSFSSKNFIRMFGIPTLPSPKPNVKYRGLTIPIEIFQESITNRLFLEFDLSRIPEWNIKNVNLDGNLKTISEVDILSMLDEDDIAALINEEAEELEDTDTPDDPKESDEKDVVLGEEWLS
jgi:hypothetical protein